LTSCLTSPKPTIGITHPWAQNSSWVYETFNCWSFAAKPKQHLLWYMYCTGLSIFAFGCRGNIDL
jgi:hypothetical protein